jgi:hypothetical protein
MVINNSPLTLTGAKAKTSIYNLDGALQSTHTGTVTAGPNAATDLGALAFPSSLSPVHFVKLELRDSKDHLVSENFYWRELPERQDDLQALNTLPTVPLEIQASRRDSAGKCLIGATVRNPTQSVALMAHLQLRKAHSGQRVLPVFYSDNYLSLLPGETKTLTIEAASADLEGDAPVLAVDGWNVTVKPVSASGAKHVQVVPNTDAQFLGATSAPANSLTETVSINCGGGPVGFFRFDAPSLGVFARDWDFKGGSGAATSGVIDVNVPNAAPAEVYQSKRWGKCAYTLPVKKGSSDTVRLHFAEVKLDPGQRKFNVAINGQRVLTDFDIAGEGGRNKAVVKDFVSISPDADGNIGIALSRGSADEPKICGIQLLKGKPE